MGTSVYVSGEIDITPHVPWGKFSHLVAELRGVRDGARSEPSRYGRGTAEVHIDAQTRELPEGTLTVKQAVALGAMFSPDTRNGDRLIRELQELVTAFGPTYTYRGYLECRSEDLDVLPWRVIIHDGTVHRIEPEMIWRMPDGETLK